MTRPDALLERAAPTEEDSRVARDASRRLAAMLAPTDATVGPHNIILQVKSNGNGTEEVMLPTTALPLLTRLLEELGQGHAVAILPVDEELTVSEAADVLNVSPPFLDSLVEQRELTIYGVGDERRLLLREVLDYKRRDDARCHVILDDLTAEAQELNMGH